MQEFVVKKEEQGQTIEKYVKKVLKEAPLSLIYKLFRKKDIKINGHWVKNKVIINDGDVVSIYITDNQLEEFKKKNDLVASDKISSWIIYEDKNVLLINKPRGILVQPDDSHQKSLDEMVKEYLMFKGEYDPNNDLAYSPGPAHRLDRNTSGITIFGKNIDSLQYLFKVLKEKEDISKKYIALVKGKIDKDGFVDAPLKKDANTGVVKIASLKDGAKKAKTIYHVISSFDNYTLLELILVTGRTHQIRVHMSYIGHPLVGDTKYGDFELNKAFEKEFHFTNQFLHAREISFGQLEKPLDKLSKQSFIAKEPDEYINIINKLKENHSN